MRFGYNRIFLDVDLEDPLTVPVDMKTFVANCNNQAVVLENITPPSLSFTVFSQRRNKLGADTPLKFAHLLNLPPFPVLMQHDILE